MCFHFFGMVKSLSNRGWRRGVCDHHVFQCCQVPSHSHRFSHVWFRTNSWQMFTTNMSLQIIFWKNRRCRTQRSFNISSLTHMMCHDFTFLFSLLRRRQSALVLHYIESAPAQSVAFLPSFRHGYHSHVCFFWPRIDFSEKPSQEKFVFVAVDSL